MSKNFEYDEDGAFFGYFCTTMVGFCLLPYTYYVIRRIWKGKKQPRDEKKYCTCVPCQKMRAQLLQKKSRDFGTILRVLSLVAFWAFFIWLMAFFRNSDFTPKDKKVFDPYAIMGVSAESSMSEVKKAYRKLLLTMHPDRGGDLAQYIEFMRAYKALTDPEARMNMEKYGSPEKPLSSSIGIALPSWLIDRKYSRIVLMVYFVVIILGAPTAIILWWLRTSKYFNEKILVETTHLFFYFIQLTPELSWKRIVTLLSSCFEFSPRYNRRMRITMQQSGDIARLARELGVKKKKEDIFNQPYAIKARVMMYCHLLRIPLPKSMQATQDEFLIKLLVVLGEFHNIVLSCLVQFKMKMIPRGPRFGSILTCMRLSSCLIQALSFSTSPLLQLPHFDEEMVALFQRKKRHFDSVQSFLSLSEKEREVLLKNFTSDQVADVYEALEAMPHLDAKVTTVVDECTNPVTIEPQSILTVLVDLKRIPLIHKLKVATKDFGKTSSNVRERSTVAKGNNQETENFDRQNSSAGAPPTPEVPRTREGAKSSANEFGEPLFVVHAPYYPYEKKEGWWCYLLYESDNSLVSGPLYFQLSAPTVQLSLQLHVPEWVGVHKYRCGLVSDSYVGFEYSQVFTVNVVKEKAQEPPPEWDISDDEVDEDVLSDTEDA